MSYPKNPETIIIKNKYYPKGLTELNIWDYYQKEKSRILNETRGRDLMFFIAIDLNDFIIRRKGIESKYIQLTNSNYDNIISGRTVSIHCGMKQYEDICVIDIDSDDFNKAKKATLDVYEIMMKASFINTVQIRFTGKTSFHIFCKLSKKIKIETIKFLTQKHLKGSGIENMGYTILGKRKEGIPNIDLAPLKVGGNFICLNSLSVIGLKCMKIDYNRIKLFNQVQSVVKV